MGYIGICQAFVGLPCSFGAWERYTRFFSSLACKAAFSSLLEDLSLCNREFAL